MRGQLPMPAVRGAAPHDGRAPLAPWPERDLDVPELLRDGWRPTPFRDVVLKVHQQCNLACDYCYVYTMADQSWRDRPAVMSREVWRAAAARMAEHGDAHDLDAMRLVLHGGEPLLAGRETLHELVTDFRSALGGRRLAVQLQTNGVLLTEPMLATLRGLGVTVGVSLDGPADHNDRRRHHRDGRGSHAGVDRALRLLNRPEHRPTFAGLLCTVDLAVDPVACYESLLAYRPPSVDFLLPHANWSVPPAAPVPAATAYGDWLVEVFDRWYGAPRQECGVRLFEDVIALLLGGSGRSEQVGASPVAVVVVETDGAVEQVDSLKSAYPGACATGLTVLRDGLDAALLHPGIVARQIGAAALCGTCRSCPVGRVCGGGHYAHRFRAGAGFRHPSVYCADMRRLIDHVARRVAADLRPRTGGPR